MKAIILLPMTCSKNTPPQGKFYRSEKHNAHIYEGREFGLDEFNKIVDKALTLFPDRSRRPTVRMISENVAEALTELPPIDSEEAHPSHLREPIIPSKKRHAKLKRGVRQPAIA